MQHFNAFRDTNSLKSKDELQTCLLWVVYIYWNDRKTLAQIAGPPKRPGRWKNFRLKFKVKRKKDIPFECKFKSDFLFDFWPNTKCLMQHLRGTSVCKLENICKEPCKTLCSCNCFSRWVTNQAFKYGTCRIFSPPSSHKCSNRELSLLKYEPNSNFLIGEMKLQFYDEWIASNWSLSRFCGLFQR